MAVMTASQVRYLIAMHESCDDNGEVRSSEVARRLGVTRPAVAKMAKTLMAKKLVTKKQYGAVCLTPSGLDCVVRMVVSINTVAERIPRLELDLNEEQTREIACMIAILVEGGAF